MVGEIRDKETAEIAMKAAQTGHLVLSSLHTNDSVFGDRSINRPGDSRLLDHLIRDGNFWPSVWCESYAPAMLSRRRPPNFRPEMVQAGTLKPPVTMAVSIGCAKCDQTGYKGRIGIYEFLSFR